ncbi:class I SAM-dependent methyltransferase [Thermodesulfobacteriota bacterium]
MREFDDPQRTWPTGHSAARLYKKTKKLVATIEALLDIRRDELHLLDVGCGSGAFISAAKDLGINTEGVEPSTGAVNAARNYGLNVHHGFLEDIHLSRETFDVATLFEVIEHLKDPISLLLECYRILRPGGLLIIRTGNTDSWTAHMIKGRWEYFNLEHHGGHIAFFNPHAIQKLAGLTGFRIIRIKTRGVSFFQKGEVSALLYRSAKIFSEILHSPSTWVGKGHEMLIFLKKPNYSGSTLNREPNNLCSYLSLHMHCKIESCE